MSAKQLALTDQATMVRVDRASGEKFYQIVVTEKHAKNPVTRAHIALGIYEGRHLSKPRGMSCHATNAAAIGDNVMGIPVWAEDHSQPDDFWFLKEA